ALTQSRVVHEYVDVLDLLEKIAPIGRARDICRHPAHVAACGNRRGCRLLQRCCATTADRYARPCLGQRLRHLAPETGSASSDQSMLAGKIESVSRRTLRDWFAHCWPPIWL